MVERGLEAWKPQGERLAWMSSKPSHAEIKVCMRNEMSSNAGITGPGHLHFWNSPRFANFRFSFQVHLEAQLLRSHLHIVKSLYCPESHVLVSCFLARGHRAFANEDTIRMASFWRMAFIRSSPHLLALRRPQTPRAAVLTTSPPVRCILSLKVVRCLGAT